MRVLKDVTLDVGAGQLVAVWGKRGAGKTTLLKIAARLERPDQGVVRFDGVDLATSARGRTHAADAGADRLGEARGTEERSADARLRGPAAAGRARPPPRLCAGGRGARARGHVRVRRPALGQPLRRRALADRDRPRDRARAEAAAGGRPDRQSRRDRARAGHRAAALARRGGRHGGADDGPGHARR